MSLKPAWLSDKITFVRKSIGFQVYHNGILKDPKTDRKPDKNEVFTSVYWVNTTVFGFYQIVLFNTVNGRKSIQYHDQLRSFSITSETNITIYIRLWRIVRGRIQWCLPYIISEYASLTDIVVRKMLVVRIKVIVFISLRASRNLFIWP